MNKDWDNLIEATAHAGINLSGKQIEQFKKYMALLQEWNKLMNLTAIEDESGIIYKHFLDSLLYSKYARAEEVGEVVDLGTGAGFPGIPLKIWLSHCQLVLVDSLQKRLNFLQEVLEALGLRDLALIHGRAEDLGKNPKFREKSELVLSRAVAPMQVLAEYCLPLVKVKGQFVAAKGPEGEKELCASEKAIAVLGGKSTEVFNYTLPFVNEERSILTITKVKSTPGKYPRKAGQPGKKPIG